MDTIQLEFEGYWTKKASVPLKSGIYCVYVGTHNPSKSTVSIRSLIYIGESKNANERINSHGKEDDWKRHLKREEVLIFSFAPITSSRDRAEAAMIFRHKPIENTEYENSFPFQSVQIETSGQNAQLESSFRV